MSRKAPLRSKQQFSIDTPTKLHVKHLAKNLGISEEEAFAELQREELLRKSYDATTLDELRLIVQGLIRLS